MKKVLLALFVLILISGAIFLKDLLPNTQTTGAPPYEIADDPPDSNLDEYSWLRDWKRPDEPTKVALQAGHWKSSDAPDELRRLRSNTGASGGGKAEWDVNLEIANETAKILSEKGITVEILPATVPPKYWADVFVSIHADGNLDSGKSGFKAASPRRDMTGKAEKLLIFVEEEYEKATNLSKDPNVTRNMRGYYAFGWWRYEHAVHPMTTSIILETGFLTSPSDRNLIVNRPEVAAEGLANGILNYLSEERLFKS